MTRSPMLHRIIRRVRLQGRHGRDVPNRTKGPGQAAENHKDHRVDLAHPDCLCALCVLCGKHHAQGGTAHPTIVQAPITVIPTEGPKARSGGTRLNSTSTRHRTQSRSHISGIAARCSKNRFLDPRCFALLRTTSLGMTTMRHPFGVWGGSH